jgi:hypothetical protein
MNAADISIFFCGMSAFPHIASPAALTLPGNALAMAK